MYEEEMNEYINILLNKPEDKPSRDYLNSRGITKNTAIFGNQVIVLLDINQDVTVMNNFHFG